MSTQHFATLRQKIDKRLHTLALDTGQTRYRWLYGALGAVPTDVMFICGNPSQRGVEEKAGHTNSTGIQLTIEDQWGSGLPLRRLRPVLCQLGLKQGAPGAPGGWQCYLTNVVKEMTLKSLGNYSESEQHGKALAWADVLEWELQQVRPSWVFCMGHPAFNLVTWLQNVDDCQRFRHVIVNYTGYGTTPHRGLTQLSSVIYLRTLRNLASLCHQAL